ncbi:MAG: NAD(P)-dependent alcohol dehydrogenase [Methanothrix sp.]|nr:MAG: NAD(P)-dependent alcohol dehydrogenase [Methanothrix sp.]
MSLINSWAAMAPKEKLVPYKFDPGLLKPDEIEIEVEYCGLCHSDISVIDNDWGLSQYPLVPGHEVVGRIVALGEAVLGFKIGERVGIGWNSESDMNCRQCLSGNHHLCPKVVPTIIGHKGGFAERIRAQWEWVLPLPENLDPSSAGPLMCGGITVFAPLVLNNVAPTDHVGVVGIGGLGHLAIKFAKAWGCEVTAFTHSLAKMEEAKKLGADHVVSSVDVNAIRALAGKLDLLLVTVNVPLDWQAFISTLAPNGRLHIVGAVLEPIPIAAFDLIMSQRTVTGSPTGSPVMMAKMLEFAARHKILPTVEHFPLSKINDAIAHLLAGKARYRVVLDIDFK